MAGSQGQAAAPVKECADIPWLFQGSLPLVLPPPAKEAAEQDVVQSGGKPGAACVGRGTNMDGRRLPGS